MIDVLQVGSTHSRGIHKVKLLPVAIVYLESPICLLGSGATRPEVKGLGYWKLGGPCNPRSLQGVRLLMVRRQVN